VVLSIINNGKQLNRPNTDYWNSADTICCVMGGSAYHELVLPGLMRLVLIKAQNPWDIKRESWIRFL